MVNVDISRILCINTKERTDRLKRIRALSKREDIDIKPEDTFICYYDNKEINNACLKFPKGDAVMKYCVDYIRDWVIANNFEYMDENIFES